jgi:hypothetical protein
VIAKLAALARDLEPVDHVEHRHRDEADQRHAEAAHAVEHGDERAVRARGAEQGVERVVAAVGEAEAERHDRRDPLDQHADRQHPDHQLRRDVHADRVDQHHRREPGDQAPGDDPEDALPGPGAAVRVQLADVAIDLLQPAAPRVAPGGRDQPGAVQHAGQRRQRAALHDHAERDHQRDQDGEADADRDLERARQVHEQQRERRADHHHADREVERGEVDQHDRRQHARARHVADQHGQLGRLAERAKRRDDVDRATADLGREHPPVRDHAGLGAHERVERPGIEHDRREVEAQDDGEVPADVVDDLCELRPAELMHHPCKRAGTEHHHHDVEDVADDVTLGLRLGQDSQ